MGKHVDASAAGLRQPVAACRGAEENTFRNQAFAISLHRGRRPSRHRQIAHDYRRRVRPDTGGQKPSRPVRQEGSSRCRGGQTNQALAKVRPSADFPNPILRLGMNASNYGQLLKKSVIERLQVNQRISRQSRPGREKALETDRAELKMGLEKTVETYAKIDA